MPSPKGTVNFFVILVLAEVKGWPWNRRNAVHGQDPREKWLTNDTDRDAWFRRLYVSMRILTREYRSGVVDQTKFHLDRRRRRKVKLPDVLAYISCDSVDVVVKTRIRKGHEGLSGLKLSRDPRCQDHFPANYSGTGLAHCCWKGSKWKSGRFKCLKEIDAMTLQLDNNLPYGDAPSSCFS